MRILIADDDPLSSDLLAQHLRKLEPTATIETAGSGGEALERLKEIQSDLLVLDLNMPGMDGRELLGVIRASLPVIITTSDREFAVDAFRHEVVDYLVKPVLFERFAQAWRKFTDLQRAGADARNSKRASEGTPARARTDARNTDGTSVDARSSNVVFVREGSDIVRLDLREVRYIKSESNYARFVLDGRSVTSLMNLKDLEVKLPSSFVRVHRSYIVNLDRVEKLDTMDVKIGGELIPVSDGYRAELIKRLDLL